MRKDTNAIDSSVTGRYDPVRIVAWAAGVIIVMLLASSFARGELSRGVVESRDQRLLQSQTLLRMTLAQTAMDRAKDEAMTSVLFAPQTKATWVAKINAADRQFDERLQELRSRMDSAEEREAATRIGAAHDSLHDLALERMDKTGDFADGLKDNPQASASMGAVLGFAGGIPALMRDMMAGSSAGGAYTAAYDKLHADLNTTAHQSQRAERRFEQSVKAFEWARNLIIIVILGFSTAHLRRWRRRASAALVELEESNERNEAVLGSTDEAIFGLDNDGRIAFANVRAESMFLGQDVEGEALHSLLHDIARTTCDDEAACAFGNVCSGDVLEQRLQARIVNTWGQEIDLEMTAFRVSGDQRDLKRVVVLHDVTERLQVEQLKDEFLSIVSHELRTPLTAMRASLGVAATGALGPLTDPLERAIGISTSNVDRLTRLIDDLLDLERGEHAELELQPNSAAGLLDATVRSHRDLAAQRGIELVTEAPDPDITVLGDRDAIEQVTTNLLGNAIKFSAQGGEIALSVSVQDGMARFEVRDYGCGVPVEEHERIFERFAQVDSSDTRGVGGTGLGLAICQQLVDRHGGAIWVESRIGEGSTFSFTLPLATSSVTDGELVPAAQEVAA